jgi:hypothetical protein
MIVLSVRCVRTAVERMRKTTNIVVFIIVADEADAKDAIIPTNSNRQKSAINGLTLFLNPTAAMRRGCVKRPTGYFWLNTILSNRPSGNTDLLSASNAFNHRNIFYWPGKISDFHTASGLSDAHLLSLMSRLRLDAYYQKVQKLLHPILIPRNAM